MSETTTPETAVWPRLLAALGAVGLGAAAVVIVAVLGHRTPGPAGSGAAKPQSAPPTSTSGAAGGKPAFPAPPNGSVVFARQDGSDILALAVVPGNRLRLQASVVDGDGKGVGGLHVSFGVDGSTHAAAPCGPGCYTTTAAGPSSPNRVDVDVVRTDRRMTWHVAMPRPWPPPDGSAIVARATHTYRSLQSFVIHDRLASDAEHAAVTRWKIVGPSSLSYQVENGAAGVIIGARRWDKVAGGTWQPSAQTPIHQPTPFWITWRDAHVLASTRDAWRVSFFDPKTPGWYELLIAKSSRRTLDMQMTAPAHFMHDTYSAFNSELRIVPPT